MTQISELAPPPLEDVSTKPSKSVFGTAALVATLAIVSASIFLLNKHVVLTVLHRFIPPVEVWEYFNLAIASLFLVESLVLCVIFRAHSGMGFGRAADWRRHVLKIGIFWCVPPLLVVAVYGPFTSHPYRGAATSMWLVEALAQEFFFTGVVFGVLSTRFDRVDGWRGTFSPPIVLTA